MEEELFGRVLSKYFWQNRNYFSVTTSCDRKINIKLIYNIRSKPLVNLLLSFAFVSASVEICCQILPAKFRQSFVDSKKNFFREWCAKKIFFP